MFGQKKDESFFGGLTGEKKKGMFGEGSSSGGLAASASSVIPTFNEEPACAKCCPKLSYTQRLYGFVACATLGYLLSFVGTMVLVGGVNPQTIKTFAVLYVLGNFIALAATGFLIGPKAQCVKMWHPTRRFTTAFFLIMLIVVFCVAVTGQNIVLIVFLLFIEILAGVWYAASFIPYGRKMILAFFRKTCCGPCFEAYDEVVASTKDSGGSSGSSKPGGMF